MRLMKKILSGAMICSWFGSLLNVSSAAPVDGQFNLLFRVVNEDGSLEQPGGCPASDHEYARLRELERLREIGRLFFAERGLTTPSPAQIQHSAGSNEM